jgi:hypothetical protein
MQNRAITGFDFEKTIISEGWERKEIKPKMNWDVRGRNIIEKIRNANFDPFNFNLSKSSQVSKSDFSRIDDESARFEVKKYKHNKLYNWTLYSEPFFKIASRDTASKIDKDVYNKFVRDFVEKRKDIIDYVLDNISKGIIGVYCIDTFIPIDNLEFKVEVLEGWKGYNRITIMFKIKES